MPSSNQRLPFRVGTWNRGNGTAEDARNLLAECDVLGLQEMGDGAVIRAAIEKAGWRIHDGNGAPGAASTPLAWNPAALRKVQLHTFPLLVTDAERAWGPGAGPGVAKPKHLVGGTFVHKATGQEVTVLNAHMPPSQYRQGRARAAKVMAGRIARAAQAAPGVVFLAMDANARPDAAPLAALRRAGLRCDQAVGMTKPTRGMRAIDQVWWMPTRAAKFVKHDVFRTRSDHRADIAEFGLLVTPRGEGAGPGGLLTKSC